MLIKSKVKYIQSLGQKKVRDEEGLFIAEGPKIVGELLNESKVNILELYALKEWAETNKSKQSVTIVTEDELAKISQLKTANQVLAVISKFPEKEIVPKNKIIVMLDGIQDPGNLGTIIRICDWFGIGEIICSKDCADMYNPKVVQSTMGSIARVNVTYVGLESWLSRHPGLKLYATALEGRELDAVGKIREGIIVIGNESKGISSEILARATDWITISRKGKAESLNAAVATGIILAAVT